MLETSITALKQCLEAGGFNCEGTDNVLKIAPTIPIAEAKKIIAAGFLVAACKDGGTPTPESSIVVIDAGTDSLTLDDTYNGKLIVTKTANPFTLTVPAGLVAEFSCGFWQDGAGQITFVEDTTTVNVNTSFIKATFGQFSGANLIHYETDVYALDGHLEAAP